VGGQAGGAVGGQAGGAVGGQACDVGGHAGAVGGGATTKEAPHWAQNTWSEATFGVPQLGQDPNPVVMSRFPSRCALLHVRGGATDARSER
jgi:hypothetical protein